MQTINGIKLEEPIPKEVNSQSGNLIILGCGECVWADYFKTVKRFKDYKVMCVNDIIANFKVEPVHHAVSVHADMLNAFMLIGGKRRKDKTLSHSVTKNDGVDVFWELENASGTSSCNALKIALLLGYEKIVLCGVPMDDSGHYYDPINPERNKSGMFNDSSLEPWSVMASDNKLKAKVRSVSGRTAMLFGEPTKEWLCQ